MGLSLVKAIRLVSLLVFLGWLILWIIWPTETYREKWAPSIEKGTSSTFFGRIQGGNILFFMFPVIFMGLAGSIYAHLRQHKGNNAKRSAGDDYMLPWRRPFMVRGPLGIISLEEFAFFAMFVLLVVWNFSVFLNVSYRNVKEIAATLPTTWTMRDVKTMLVCRGLGFAGNLCLVFLLFPVTRGTSILPLFGLTSEASVQYHTWIGHIAMVLMTGHGVGNFILWGLLGEPEHAIEWTNAGISNVAGELSLLFGVILWMTTFKTIRRKRFEVFFYTHQLYSLFLFFYILHVSMSVITYILPGIFLFIIDRYLRFLQSRNGVRLTSARLLPDNTIELNFAKSPECYYATGSVVFLNVPSVSRLQWHPFSVSSSCGLEPDRLSVTIKREGSWTRKLHQALAPPSSTDYLYVSLEGPYGPTCNDYFMRYNSLVRISGGSGITPFISFIREIVHVKSTSDCPTPNSIHLICSFRTSADLTMLDLLLPPEFAASQSSDLLSRLRIDAFVTRERQRATDLPTIRHVTFKSFPYDLPVSPILGPNSWLWLAAVISSSFVFYLILLGLLYRYFVYPKDGNTKEVFSYTAKAIFNIMFMCAGICACGGIAVWWNKRLLANKKGDGNRVASVVTPDSTPSVSHSPGRTEQELESFPTEFLVRNMNVHYGGRPNLKKMLLECNDSNTGVFASGPAALRREAAAAVSSGMFDNLSFQAVTFSW